MISTYLVSVTDEARSPSYYIVFTALVTLLGVLTVRNHLRRG